VAEEVGICVPHVLEELILRLAHWLSVHQDVPLDALSAWWRSQAARVGIESGDVKCGHEVTKIDVTPRAGSRTRCWADHLLDQFVLLSAAQLAVKEDANDTTEGTISPEMDNVKLTVEMVAVNSVLGWAVDVHLEGLEIASGSAIEGAGVATIVALDAIGEIGLDGVALVDHGNIFEAVVVSVGALFNAEI